MFCPKCNLQVSAREIAKGHGGHSGNPEPFDEFETEYHGDYYSVAVCPQCESAFLLKESIYTILGENSDASTTELLFPRDAPLLAEHLPETVKRTYEQAKRCFATSSYDACALMCRASLEALCRSLGFEEGNLNNKLETLTKKGIIDSRLLGWAHGVRHVGNKAAHSDNTAVSKEDARDALDFAEALLTYVFVLTKKFEAFSARRNK